MRQLYSDVVGSLVCFFAISSGRKIFAHNDDDDDKTSREILIQSKEAEI